MKVAQAVSVHADIQAISTSLKVYESMNGFLPTTDQGLQALVIQPETAPVPTRWRQLLEKLPTDPWGMPYIYRAPGIKNPEGYDLFSSGPDGRPDTADDDLGQ